MEGTLAEIRMFGGNFGPRSWALCEGQLLPISQNQALFSLLGTIYGGDGRTTFQLPDFRGRVPVGTGTGAGLSPVPLGSRSGQENTTLNVTNLPSHTHALTGAVTQQANNDATGLTDDPTNKRLGASGAIFTGATDDLVPMAPFVSTLALGNTGGNQSFSNRQPYLGINFIICLQGIFPSRN